MSSHTHPQNVHVACLTTFSVIPLSTSRLVVTTLVSARTGRDDEGSPKLPPWKASPRSARHVPTGLDHFPRRRSHALHRCIVCGFSRTGVRGILMHRSPPLR